jgi:hypothetical protein
MRGFQRGGNLQRQLQGFFDGDGPALEPVRQRLPFDQFEDQEVLALVFFEAMNYGDVG